MNLETHRLLLRPWREEDLDSYARICSDARTMRYMRSGTMTREQTASQIERLMRHWDEHGYGLWAVEEKPSGEFIGRVGLMRYGDFVSEPEGSRTEVGFLLDRRRWGQGLATEGVAASLQWAFKDLGFERIISIMQPDNLGSRRVIEKAGLTLQGSTEWKDYDWVWYALDRRTRAAVGT